MEKTTESRRKSKGEKKGWHVSARGGADREPRASRRGSRRYIRVHGVRAGSTVLSFYGLRRRVSPSERSLSLSYHALPPSISRVSLIFHLTPLHFLSLSLAFLFATRSCPSTSVSRVYPRGDRLFTARCDLVIPPLSYFSRGAIRLVPTYTP